MCAMPLRYETKKIEATKLKPDDLIIAFMGPTGSGKSQIIDTLTGQPGKRANHTLTSTNVSIAAFRVLNHKTFESRLVLIETPGVDNKGDRAILQMISDWLPKETRSISLSGIIYLHQITDPRMTGQLDRNLHKFGELCGKNWAQSIILVTTMWNKVRNDIGEEREEGLKNKYWKGMIDDGAVLYRFLNTPDSAWKIVSKMAEERMKVVPQEERRPATGVWGRLFGRRG